MENEAERANRLLTPGHLYLWDGKLLKAGKSDEFWHLLCFDAETGAPVSYAPGALVGYTLRRNTEWQEAFAQSFDNRDDLRKGAIVQIELEKFVAAGDLQFKPKPAPPPPSELLDGHVYSQFVGLYFFRADKSPRPVGSRGNAWLLKRIDSTTGDPIQAVEGDLVAYLVDSDGNWWRVTAQDLEADEGRPKLHRLYSKKQLPYFVHEADSVEDFLLNKDFRGIMLGEE